MRAPVVVALALAASACGSAPPELAYGVCTPELRGADAERCVGLLTEQTLTAALGVYEDERLTAYVRAVGERIVAASDRRDVDYRFVILDAPEAEAWAAPGGRVFVTRGLLARIGSEAELAAVLGHEVGHVAAGHVDHLLDDVNAPRWDDVVALTRALEHERDEERQADQLAVILLRRAGYDPSAMTDLLEAVYRDDDETGWADRHPPLPVRLALVARAADGEAGSDRQVERYLRHIDGLVVGHDPRFGAIRARRYVSAAAGVAFTIPDGWEAPEVRALAYGVRDPERAFAVGFVRLGRAGELYPERALRRDLEAEGVERTELAGREAVVGWLPGGQGSRVRLDADVAVSRVAVFTGRDGAAYALFVAAQDDARAPIERLYAQMAATFEPFDAPVLPRRVRLRALERTARLDDLDGCAAPHDRALWAIVNGLDPDEELPRGRVIKCIER